MTKVVHERGQSVQHGHTEGVPCVVWVVALEERPANCCELWGVAAGGVGSNLALPFSIACSSSLLHTPEVITCCRHRTCASVFLD